jgi:hypothetical protein
MQKQQIKVINKIANVNVKHKNINNILWGENRINVHDFGNGFPILLHATTPLELLFPVQ